MSVNPVMHEAEVMVDRLRKGGIRTAVEARALNIAERDAVLGVSAWGGQEDDAWMLALQQLGNREGGMVTLPVGMAADVLRLAELIDDVTPEEAAARETLDVLVDLAQQGVEPLGVIRPGTLLVWRPIDLRIVMDDEVVSALMDLLRRTAGHREFGLVVCEPGEDIALLDEKAMEWFGWERIVVDADIAEADDERARGDERVD